MKNLARRWEAWAGPQAGWGLGWLLPALQLLISVGGTPGGQSTALGGPIHYCIGGGPLPAVWGHHFVIFDNNSNLQLCGLLE
jgi:hypothetical protein